jgi:Tol biopolymer transport system component
MKRLVTFLAVAAMSLFAVVGCGGNSARATMPGKNGLIAFSLDDGSGGEIYTIEADGTDLSRLTHLKGNAIAPDWSPDGSRIAFWLEDRTLYTMAADGSDLLEVASPGGQAAFTPDGQHLLYTPSDPDVGHGIFLVRTDGSDAPGRLLADPFPESDYANPEMSPDGRTITFDRDSGVFAVDVDGTHARMLVSSGLFVVVKHDWAPDGSRIVFTPFYTYEQNPNVMTIGTDGTGLDKLTHATGAHGACAGGYSPDGAWIVFRRENLDRGRFSILRMHADGSDRTLIARMPFSPRFLDWGAQPES